MDQKTVLKQLSNDGPFVVTKDCVVRRKDHPFTVLGGFDLLMGVLASGHIVIKNNHVYLTASGRSTLTSQRSRSAGYAQRMRDRGCVRKSLWVHPDDITRFDEFMMTLKGPSDD